MAKKQNGKPTKKAAAPKAKARASSGAKKGTSRKAATNVVPEPRKRGLPPAPNPRLPAVGTVIQKRDRHGVVRCECSVEKEGVRYSGTIYRSISSAALAAARDLGLRNKSENGYVFWGLVKPGRPVSDPVAAFERAWGRYLERAEALVRTGVSEEDRTKVATAIAEQAATIAKLVETLGRVER